MVKVGEGGEILIFPLLPIVRHPGLSALVTFLTSPIIFALFVPNYLLYLHQKSVLEFQHHLQILQMLWRDIYW